MPCTAAIGSQSIKKIYIYILDGNGKGLKFEIPKSELGDPKLFSKYPPMWVFHGFSFFHLPVFRRYPTADVRCFFRKRFGSA